jgi:hypothetical protein
MSLEASAISACDRPVKAGYIYFLEAVGMRRIKIGFTSKNPNLRTDKIACGLPVGVVLHGYMPGTVEFEKSLHERFWTYGVGHEWFKFAKEIRQYIAFHAIPWPKNGEFVEVAVEDGSRIAEQVFKFSFDSPPVSRRESSWWMNRRGANPGTLVRLKRKSKPKRIYADQISAMTRDEVVALLSS